MARRFVRLLQYQLNRLLARGSLIQYLLLVLIGLFVVLLGVNAWFVGLFTPEALRAEGIDDGIDGGLFDALWWSLKHVVDPGAFAEDYGAPWPVLLISLLLSVTGLAILGVFIGFVTTSVQRRLEQLRKGDTSVETAGHTLILGWSQKVASILDFLARVGRRRTVVILAQQQTAEVQTGLRLHQRNWKSLEIVLRSGSTSSIADLERVRLAAASSVISVAQRRDDRGGYTDIETIKTLMLLSGYDGWTGARPRMVAEITQKRNVEVANIAGARSIPLVSTSEIISKAIVQATRQPGISRFYQEVFSFGGNTIFVRHVPEAAGRTFGEIAHWFPDAIPIGVSWKEGPDERLRAALNPEPDYDLAADEQVILLARDEAIRVEACSPPEHPAASGALCKHRTRLERLLILGWNDNIDEILSEVDAHASRDAVVTIVAGYEPDAARQSLTTALPAELGNLKIDYRRGDTVNRRTLEALDLAGYDSIVTLADESHLEEDPDARTIMTLLLLTDIGRVTQMPHVVTEIYDAANAELLEGTVARDVIVSPEMVSLQIAQISRHQVLGSIYRELLSAGGIECRLEPAGRYVALGESCSFSDLVVACQRHTEVALGIWQHDAGAAPDAADMQLNPARDARWIMTEADRVVVLAQQLYE